MEMYRLYTSLWSCINITRCTFQRSLQKVINPRFNEFTVCSMSHRSINFLFPAYTDATSTTGCGTKRRYITPCNTASHRIPASQQPQQQASAAATTPLPRYCGSPNPAHTIQSSKTHSWNKVVAEGHQGHEEIGALREEGSRCFFARQTAS